MSTGEGAAFDKLMLLMLSLCHAGLHKPHLPFSAPQWAYDLYPPAKVSLPSHPGFPVDAPPIAFHDNNGHPDVASPWIPLPDNRTRELRRAYMACVSFMDSQLGDILSELNALGLASNTVVAFHGDVRLTIGLLWLNLLR